MAEVVPLSLPPLTSSITVAAPRAHVAHVAVPPGELPRHLLPAESVISPRKHYVYHAPKQREEYDARQAACRMNWRSDRMPPPIRDRDTDAKRARRQEASDLRAMLAVQAVEAKCIAFTDALLECAEESSALDQMVDILEFLSAKTQCAAPPPPATQMDPHRLLLSQPKDGKAAFARVGSVGKRVDGAGGWVLTRP